MLLHLVRCNRLQSHARSALLGIARFIITIITTLKVPAHSGTFVSLILINAHSMPSSISKDDYTGLGSPASHIRLMRVHPEKLQSRVELSMEIASFSSWPVYDALSYTWDNGPRKRSIPINGKRHTVSNHLWGVLHSIRDQRPSGHAFIWVDALCINQDNEDEKALQIAAMPFIYERAQTVFL